MIHEGLSATATSMQETDSDSEGWIARQQTIHIIDDSKRVFYKVSFTIIV